MLKLLGALLILSVGVFSAYVSVQYEKKRLTVVDGWIDLILYIRGQIDCYLLPIGDILSGGDRALFEACMSPSNAADLPAILGAFIGIRGVSISSYVNGISRVISYPISMEIS